MKRLSPSRAALLTGRNHHTCNVGAVEDISTAFPGNTGIRPHAVVPVAEMLRRNGYNTGAFGKWHLAPLWETSVSGPFDNWPIRSGFEKFYGFLGGETNQWAPLIYDGVTKVELPKDPNYHFMTDMTNQAIAWARFQHAMTPDRPFFLYFRPVPRMRRTTRRRHGRISTRESSTAVGIGTGRRRLPARSRWASCRRVPSSPPSPRTSFS